jgi:hypothetical protein
MTDGEFQKMTQSEEMLYGPRKLLLCGFPPDVQSKFMTLLEMIGLSELPVVWVADDQANAHVGELVRLDDGTGSGDSSKLPRAIIMSGISQNELHSLMAGCRKSGMQPPLWATLTPTSEAWPIQKLLKELAAERRAMQKLKQQQAKT